MVLCVGGSVTQGLIWHGCPQGEAGMGVGMGMGMGMRMERVGMEMQGWY
jgi:hypothetical protein